MLKVTVTKLTLEALGVYNFLRCNAKVIPKKIGSLSTGVVKDYFFNMDIQHNVHLI